MGAYYSEVTANIAQMLDHHLNPPFKFLPLRDHATQPRRKVFVSSMYWLDAFTMMVNYPLSFKELSVISYCDYKILITSRIVSDSVRFSLDLSIPCKD